MEISEEQFKSFKPGAVEEIRPRILREQLGMEEQKEAAKPGKPGRPGKPGKPKPTPKRTRRRN